MPNPAHETVVYPFTGFNFAVEISLPGRSGLLVSAAFAECDGLEVNMEVKTLREGGNNGALIRLAAPVGYGTLTLKRGMSANFDLWEWLELSVEDPSLRADAMIVLLAADGASERAVFTASRCLPVKLKAPALNAKEGAVAVEELQLAYESLSIRPGR
jgi:phage tail-like protein